MPVDPGTGTRPQPKKKRRPGPRDTRTVGDVFAEAQRRHAARTATIDAAPRSVFIPPALAAGGQPAPVRGETWGRDRLQMRPGYKKPKTRDIDEVFRLALGRPARVDIHKQPRTDVSAAPEPMTGYQRTQQYLADRDTLIGRGARNIAEAVPKYGGAIAQAATESVLQQAHAAAEPRRGISPLRDTALNTPAALGIGAGARAGFENLLVGPEAGKFIMGQPYSGAGLGLDLAGAAASVLGAGGSAAGVIGAGKIARRGGSAAKVARRVRVATHGLEGERVEATYIDEMLGPVKIEGTLEPAKGRNIKIVTDDGVEHTIGQRRVLHAGTTGSTPEDLNFVPSREAALEQLGAPVRPAGASRKIAKEVLSEGHPLPARLQDENELGAAVEKVAQLAREGAGNRDWYDRAANMVRIIADHYKLPYKQVAQVIAITSAGADTRTNITFAIKAIEQHLAGKPIGSGRWPVRQSEEIRQVFKSKGWSGRKRNSFYMNMIEGLDPEEYARMVKEVGRESPVTVDMWVVRMFAPFLKKDVPDEHYEAFEQMIAKLARDFGWTPKELQAAAWVAAKARGILPSDIRRAAGSGRVTRMSSEEVDRLGRDAYEIGTARSVDRPDLDPRGVGDGRERGAGDVHFTELDPGSRSARTRFVTALKGNRATWSVSPPEAKKLRESRIFMTKGGGAGFAIAPDGELYAVFRNDPALRGGGVEAALQAAHRGSSHLNVYDIPALRRVYEQAGYTEVARIPHDPAHVDEASRAALAEHGNPDVVFMAFGAKPHPVRVFDDWDNATAYTRSVAEPATPARDLTREGFTVSRPPEHAEAAKKILAELTARERKRDKLSAAAKRGAATRKARAMELASEERGSIQFGKAERPAPEPDEIPPLAVAEDPAFARAELARPADDIRRMLPTARARIREQNELRHNELVRRVAAGREAFENGLEGEAAFEAAKAELRGEMPKLDLIEGGITDFNQTQVDAMMSIIRINDDLQFLEKIRAMGAVRKAVNGKLPQANEIKLLQRVFGHDLTASVVKSVHGWKKWKQAGYQVINIPRSFQASVDLSAPFRQGLVLGVRHPALFAKNLPKMIKAAGSQPVWDEMMNEIGNRSTYDLMKKAKIFFSGLDDMTEHEEMFASDLAETLTGGKYSPVRASGRGYSGFLNKFRADAFDTYVRTLERQGYDLNDPKNQKLLEDIGNWINLASGRGKAPFEVMEGANQFLNAIFFSPRLAYSRLHLVNPATYLATPGGRSPGTLKTKFARKQARAAMRNLSIAVGLTLGIAKAAGADIEIDPRSSDFGKIRVGDSRYDVSGGLLGYITLAARLGTMQTKSSTTGAVTDLTGGFATPSPWSVLGSFAENKTAPVPGLAIDLLKNENFDRDPLWGPEGGNRWAKEILSANAPLNLSGTYKAYKTQGPGAAAATLGLGTFGFGANTYATKPPKAAVKSYKSELAQADAALQAGEISEADAEEWRNGAEANFVATVRKAQLKAKGLSVNNKFRQEMLDSAAEQGMSLEQANDLFAEQPQGMRQITAKEYAKTVRELLEIQPPE